MISSGWPALAKRMYADAAENEEDGQAQEGGSDQNDDERRPAVAESTGRRISWTGVRNGRDTVPPPVRS